MKAQIVSFHCVLKDKLGKVLSSSFNQDVINQFEYGGSGVQRLQGLVNGLQNVHEGEKRQIEVSANEAFGPYRPELVLSLHRSELARFLGPVHLANLAIGSEVTGDFKSVGVLQTYRVVQFSGQTIVLDANHPLAGHDVTFDIEIVSARDACREDFEDASANPAQALLH